MPNFLILRNSAAIHTASPFEAMTAAHALAGPAAPAPRVELHDVSRREAAPIARDPQVAAVAIPMPTKLIAPKAVAAAAAAVGAWGIPAVKADTSPATGDGVVVSILDTGIDKTHPAFAGVDIQEQDFSG